MRCDILVWLVALGSAGVANAEIPPILLDEYDAFHALPPALLATGLGGLWRSTDGFVTRTKVIDGAVDKVEFQNPTAVIATGEKIWRSTDAGATFSVAYEQKGVSASTFAVTRFSFHPGGVWGLAVAQISLPNTDGSMILRTEDGGATWSQRGKITTDGSIYAGITVLVDLASGRPRFARFKLHGPSSVSVDIAYDLGDTWYPATSIEPLIQNNSLQLQNAYDVDIFSDASSGTIIVTGWSKESNLTHSNGASGPLQSGVFLRSEDVGYSWTQELPVPNAHVTSNTSFGTAFYELAFQGISACPAGYKAKPCTQYAVAGAIDLVDSAGYVLRSDDDGTTWVTLHETFDSNLRDLAVSPSRRGAHKLCAVGIKAALETAKTSVAVVSCSVNGGKTWTHAPPLPFPKLSPGARLWETLSIALA